MVVERLANLGNLARVHGYVFGKRAAARKLGVEKNFVAQIEARHRATDRSGDTRSIGAEPNRKALRYPGCHRAGAQLSFDRVDTSRNRPHQQVAYAAFRHRRVFKLHQLRAAAGVNVDGFHRV